MKERDSIRVSKHVLSCLKIYLSFSKWYFKSWTMLYGRLVTQIRSPPADLLKTSAVVWNLCWSVCSSVCFGFMLQIVNINMSCKVHLITFLPSSSVPTILLELIINMSPSKIVNLRAIWTKINILWRRGISDEEEELAMTKGDHAMMKSNKIARNRKCTAVLYHKGAICVIIYNCKLQCSENRNPSLLGDFECW